MPRIDGPRAVLSGHVTSSRPDSADLAWLGSLLPKTQGWQAWRHLPSPKQHLELSGQRMAVLGRPQPPLQAHRGAESSLSSRVRDAAPPAPPAPCGSTQDGGNGQRPVPHLGSAAVAPMSADMPRRPSVFFTRCLCFSHCPCAEEMVHVSTELYSLQGTTIYVSLLVPDIPEGWTIHVPQVGELKAATSSVASSKPHPGAGRRYPRGSSP